MTAVACKPVQETLGARQWRRCAAPALEWQIDDSMAELSLTQNLKGTKYYFTYGGGANDEEKIKLLSQVRDAARRTPHATRFHLALTRASRTSLPARKPHTPRGSLHTGCALH